MSKKQTVLRTGLGTLFIGAGIIQATHREFFTALIPVSYTHLTLPTILLV